LPVLFGAGGIDPQPDFTQGDAEKGKQGCQRGGVCVNCHGLAGDGKSGRNPASHSAGAHRRETKLIARGLYDAIRYGVPGAQMAYHDSVSYRDNRCFGMPLADFNDGQQSIMDKTFREKQMVDLIGQPTNDERVLYFDASADAACACLKDN